MRVIQARNVHAALPEAVYQLLLHPVVEQSRNGQVVRSPLPVTTLYENPRERVLFWPQRDANPWFHFYEGLWMLNGQNDVASLTRFVKRMANFSDDGQVFHGAYGHRWRKWFGFDQLLCIAQALHADNSDRRQVLQMWDGVQDLRNQQGRRDVPCNTHAYFEVNMGALDMMVCNRSNDIVWGCYGANAVHFSMLQEVLAAMVGVPVGMYWQVSKNWHAYQDTLEKVRELAQYAAQPALAGMLPNNPYQDHVKPFPMVNSGMDTWFSDLNMFMGSGGTATGYRDVFFRRVAVPMLRVHDLYKGLDQPDCYHAALAACEDIAATDWRMACEQWLHRRLAAWEAR